MVGMENQSKKKPGFITDMVVGRGSTGTALKI